MENSGKPPQSTDQLDNSLHSRMEELLQLLSANATQLTAGQASEEQFRSLMAHCFTLYDQLDFITLQYSRSPAHYLQPKQLASHCHRALRTTKYLVSNIRHWVQAHSLAIMQQISQGNYYAPPQTYAAPMCALCSTHIEQIAVRDVQQALGCASQMRQRFEEELQEEREGKALAAKGEESKEYIHSVNYLTRIIREMEESAQGYDRLLESVERGEKEENSEDISLRLLEEMVLKVQIRLGQKCRLRLKRMLKGLDNASSTKMDISQQLNVMVKVEGKPKQPLPTPQDLLVRRLKAENSRLQAERNQLSGLYNSTKDVLAQMEQRQKHANFTRQLHTASSQKIQSQSSATIQDKENQGQDPLGIEKLKIIKEGHLIVTRKEKKNLKRLSIFNVRRQSRQSDGNSALNQTADTLSRQRDSQQLVSLACVHEENEGKTVDVGCQWQDQFNAKFRNSIDTRFRNDRSSLANFDDRRGKQSITAQDLYKTSPKFNSNNTRDSNRDLFDKMGKDRNKKSGKQGMQNKGRGTGFAVIEERINNQQKSNRFTLNNIHRRAEMEGEAAMRNEDISTAQFGKANRKKRQGRSTNGKREKPQLAAIKSYRLEVDSGEEEEIVKPNRQTEDQFDKDNMNISQKGIRFKKQRIATQGNERDRKKDKNIPNNLFKPEHLALFGGVSQSYAYEKSKLSEGQEHLSVQERQQLDNLTTYITNLRGFKNNYFQNVVGFLMRPFQTIEQNEIKPTPISKQQIRNTLLKLLLFHHKKCSSSLCEHLSHFALMIGHS